MSQNFMTGKMGGWTEYLFPLFAFALGVLIAEQIQHKYKYAKTPALETGNSGSRDYNPVCCRIYSTTRKYDRDCSGILCLCDAGAEFPEGKWIFICKYYVYRKLTEWNGGIILLSEREKPEQLRQAMYYLGIIVLFAIGAGIGGNLSANYGIHMIWVSCGLLIVSFLLMFLDIEARRSKDKKGQNRDIDPSSDADQCLD